MYFEVIHLVYSNIGSWECHILVSHTTSQLHAHSPRVTFTIETRNVSSWDNRAKFKDNVFREHLLLPNFGDAFAIEARDVHAFFYRIVVLALSSSLLVVLSLVFLDFDDGTSLSFYTIVEKEGEWYSKRKCSRRSRRENDDIRPTVLDKTGKRKQNSISFLLVVHKKLSSLPFVRLED